MPTCTISVAPSSFPSAGGLAAVTFTTTNASDMSIHNGTDWLTPGGWVTATASGMIRVTITRTTTYHMEVSGPGGVSSCEANATLAPPPTPPTCTLSASPATINAGGSSTLTWTTTGDVVDFSIDQGVGSVSPAAGGSVSVSPPGDIVYTGTVINTAGQRATCAAQVMVAAPPPPSSAPTCTLSANPTSTSGGPSTLSWTTS
ncbi:MAG TPA: hypothetical protein VFK72_00065, partial [Nevskia sp.]|nr:hypothetical protein [Nevskia sp.]